MARPAKESMFAFQPASFCFTLSKTKLYSWEEDPGCLIGIPRYLPSEGVEAKPRISLKDSLVSLSTLGEKYTLDFASLIVCPDMLQNSSKTSLMAEQLVLSAFANKTKSSAKNNVLHLYLIKNINIRDLSLLASSHHN